MNEKQLNVLFDALLYLKDGGQGDFTVGKVKANAKQVQAFVGKQVQNFIRAGYNKLGEGKFIQAFTGTSDMTVIDTNVWNAFQEENAYDVLWQRAFRAVPLRKGQLDWSIGTVTSGVALKLLEEGEKVDYAAISGSKIKGEVDLYGGGLEIDWKTMEGRDLAGFYNSMSDFKAKRMEKQATIFYGLLAAAATEVIDYQLTTDDPTIDRDIATINKGYETVSEECKDLGFGDTANASMLLYHSPNLKGRVQQALRATSEIVIASGGRGQLVNHTIEPLVTWNSSIPTNKAMMVLPGNKIQNSNYMKEKTFERINPDNLSWLKSSFSAFGGVVGETAQTAMLEFAD